jgi:hypothetical protein
MAGQITSQQKIRFSGLLAFFYLMPALPASAQGECYE